MNTHKVDVTVPVGNESDAGVGWGCLFGVDAAASTGTKLSNIV